jgi:hypothetical protein
MWFSVRLRTPSPRHRPICELTTPALETIGSVGRYMASSAIFVSGNGSARSTSSRTA